MSVVHRACLLLHRHLHRDRLQRNVAFVSRGGDDLVDDVEPAKHFSEDGIAAAETAVVSHEDKELHAVVVELAGPVALALAIISPSRLGAGVPPRCLTFLLGGTYNPAVIPVATH